MKYILPFFLVFCLSSKSYASEIELAEILPFHILLKEQNDLEPSYLIEHVKIIDETQGTFALYQDNLETKPNLDSANFSLTLREYSRVHVLDAEGEVCRVLDSVKNVRFGVEACSAAYIKIFSLSDVFNVVTFSYLHSDD